MSIESFIRTDGGMRAGTPHLKIVQGIGPFDPGFLMILYKLMVSYSRPLDY